MSTMTHDHEHIIKLSSGAGWLHGAVFHYRLRPTRVSSANGGNFVQAPVPIPNVPRYVSWRFRAATISVGNTIRIG